MVLRTMEKAGKLCSMSPLEMSYRAREQLRMAWDRILPKTGGHQETGDPLERCFSKECREGPGDGLAGEKREFSYKEYLQGGPARRFYFPREEEGYQLLQQFASVCFPDWTAKAIDEADLLLLHRMELLGHGELDLGTAIQWHRDPVTGRQWELRFWADYDLVHDRSAGDPKVIHELNRHQHLPRLAKAFFLTGKDKYAQEAIAQMIGWIEQNPAGLGINWNSSLEIGLRVISWLWTLFLLLPAPSFEERTARAILKSIFLQLEHIYRYPSRFSSPNTHLLGEAVALYIGGTIFSEWKPAGQWQQLGAALLEEQMDKQVPSEGVHAELSSYYHCYTLDFYLQAMILSNRNRSPFPGWMWQRLERMIDFLLHLTRPDGSIPLLGDDDGGRALAINEKDYHSFRDALCTGAVLFRRPDLKQLSGRFHEETFWLLGREGWQQFTHMENKPPSQLQALYPQSGYFIQRSDWGDRAAHLIFDCGGLGILNGGHGHADALSVVLSSQGQELLVDPGTYAYNVSPQWRNFFRSTRAHNTAVVDGQDQSECGGTFNWRRKATTRPGKQLTLAGIEYIDGEVKSGTRLGPRIGHRRRLFYCRPSYWAIADEFQGRGSHQLELYYHFPPNAEVSIFPSDDNDKEIIVRMSLGQSGLQLLFCTSVPIQAEVISGQDSPIQGWVSSRYGRKTAAPAVRIAMNASFPVKTLSLLLPLDEQSRTDSCGNTATPADFGTARQQGTVYQPPRMRSVQIAGGQGIACNLENAGYSDWIVLPRGDSRLEFLESGMRGQFFWMRMVQGRLTRLFAADVLHFSLRGNPVINNLTPLDYIQAGFDEDSASVSNEMAGEKDLCAEFVG